MLTTGHPRPVVDFYGRLRLRDGQAYYEAFEQGVIEGTPAYPALQSTSDKTTTVFACILPECRHCNAGGRLGSPIWVWLTTAGPRRHPSLYAQVLIRFPSDARDKNISLKRISRPLPLLLTPRGTLDVAFLRARPGPRGSLAQLRPDRPDQQTPKIVSILSTKAGRVQDTCP